ncbi:MAG: hypothetical protein ACF8Q5_09530 [Phycisphaerales bacterium JB040]
MTIPEPKPCPWSAVATENRLAWRSTDDQRASSGERRPIWEADVRIGGALRECDRAGHPRALGRLIAGRPGPA